MNQTPTPDRIVRLEIFVYQHHGCIRVDLKQYNAEPHPARPDTSLKARLALHRRWSIAAASDDASLAGLLERVFGRVLRSN